MGVAGIQCKNESCSFSGFRYSRGSEIVLNAFKANATRQMREDGCWQKSYSPWVDKGSRRNLWNERSVARALDYVINGQGEDLPEFD
jgi:hypothetical protein